MKTIHRNLNTGGWTIKQSSDSPAEQVFRAVARGVTIKQPSGRKFAACRQEGAKRAVFAWFKCEDVAEVPHTDCYLDAAVGPLERVRFDPKTDNHFHIDGERVDALSWACFTAEGECWGVRA